MPASLAREYQQQEAVAAQQQRQPAVQEIRATRIQSLAEHATHQTLARGRREVIQSAERNDQLGLTAAERPCPHHIKSGNVSHISQSAEFARAATEDI